MPTIYLDSTAVISLVMKGGGITRTKHLRARTSLGMEMVDQGCTKVEYQPVCKRHDSGWI